MTLTIQVFEKIHGIIFVYHRPYDWISEVCWDDLKDMLHHTESVPNLPDDFIYDDHPDLNNGNYSVNPLKKMNSFTSYVIWIFFVKYICYISVREKYLIIIKGCHLTLFHKSKVCLDSSFKKEFFLL
jgi:hypothetical protein